MRLPGALVRGGQGRSGRVWRKRMAYEILARAADVSNQTEMEPDASQRGWG